MIIKPSVSRYRYASVVKDTDGFWLSPSEPSYSLEIRGSDIYHIVRDYDRLDLLAETYLGEARLWWVIAEFNNIFWMFDLEVGSTLRIPSYERLTMEVLS